MVRNHLTRTIDSFLDLLLDGRLGLRCHYAPATLELLQRCRKQRIVRAVTVSVDAVRARGALGVPQLMLAHLLQQAIGLAGENLVDAFVVPASDVLDELPQLS